MFRKIPFNVWILGFVSFFNDIASEMIYPLVPIFLTSVLNAPVTTVGLIEGVAEGMSNIVKFFSGYFSDKVHSRKPFVVAGYSLGAVSKLLIGLAYSWPFVLFARFIDRLGKGVRTSARDSMLLQNTTKDNKGMIFGFHRAMDSAGAIVGPLLALVLLYFLKDDIRLVFLLAFIPGVIGVILLLLFVKEKKVADGGKKFQFHFKWKELNPNFKFFLLILVIFSLGNSSDAFLILRAKDLGLSTLLVTLAYVLYNIVQAAVATPAGSLADRIGKRKVFAGGLLIFSAVYFAFGLISSSFWIWFLFPIYGLYIAFTDGVSKAYISEFMDERESGTYFGIYQTALGFATFFASFAGGYLWDKFGASSTFYFGAIMSLLAFLILFYGKFIKKI